MKPDQDIIPLRNNWDYNTMDQVENNAGLNSMDISDGDFKTKKTDNLFYQFLKNKKVLCTVAMIPVFVLANYLYISCDEYCTYRGFTYCLIFLINKKIVTWMVKVFLAALIFFILIVAPLYFKKTIARIIAPLALINLIYLIFFFDPVITGLRYGGAFAILLALDMLTIFTLFGIVKIILYCIKKRPRLSITILIILVVSWLTWFYFAKYKGSCDHWAIGLGGDKIDDDVTCVIGTPQICHYDILEGVISLSLWQCSSFPADPKVMNKFFPQSPIIGLPRVETAPDVNRTLDYLQDYVLAHTVGLSSLEDETAKDLEVFIDQRDKENTKIIIDVKRNETLVEERKKLQDDEVMAQNLLIIFVDTLSRARLFTKLPRTAAWFEKFYNGKSPERETYQFFKFHSVTPYTVNNMIAMNYGIFPNHDSRAPDSDDKKARNYIGEFKNKGYITGRSGGLCDNFATVIPYWARYLKDTPCDHENTIACDPNYQSPDAPFAGFQGPFSMRRRCLYGREMAEPIFEYADQFMRVYSKEKKLLWMDFLDAHEVTQETIKFLDSYMVNFLEGLDRDHLLDDTMILFWSDHGNHMPFPPYDIIKDTTTKEKGLPSLLFVLPPTMISKYGPSVKSNQQKLFSAFQLHEILMAFPNGANSTHLAKSVFSPLPLLTCKDLLVTDMPCVCEYPTK